MSNSSPLPFSRLFFCFFFFFFFFFCLCCCFQDQHFRKTSSGIPSECQTVAHCLLVACCCFFSLFDCFCFVVVVFKINFFVKHFRNTIRVSNSLDPDQARHFVGHDMCPNYLQRLHVSADVTSIEPQWS